MSGFGFDLNRKRSEHPAISVICINKNHGEYIEEALFSIVAQKFDDYEVIIADGGSTDSSLEIIRKYEFVRLLSGVDSSGGEGLNRALAAAHGRYVMVTTSTDGYLSRDWFKSVASVLDQDPLVSLVFGASAAMSSAGTLGPVTYPTSFPFYEVPPKDKWPGNWLLNGFGPSYLPELNYCARISIFKKCFGPSTEFPELNAIDPILRFHFEFNRQGYLPQYLPTLANFGRSHANQEQYSERNLASCRVYDETWKRYREEVASGQRTHLLRDGQGKSFAQIGLRPNPVEA